MDKFANKIFCNIYFLLLLFKPITLCWPDINVARVFSSRDQYYVAADGVALVRVRVGQDMSRTPRSLAIYSQPAHLQRPESRPRAAKLSVPHRHPPAGRCKFCP